MKLKEFKKAMKKSVFRTAEAQLIGFKSSSSLVNLQLYQWKLSGDLIQLKRGVYAFSEAKLDSKDIARALYEPCYFSLEYVLNLHNIMPEVVFAHTLVTTKATRKFTTPLGDFYFRKIKKEAFLGFDPDSLVANKEKALVDYFYLNSAKLIPNRKFWTEMRFYTEELNFKKIFQYASAFKSKKLIYLLNNFKSYAKA